MLLLRKECEVILTAYGLQELHIQRNDIQKCLSIVGSCGKELVTIYGINIPSRLKDSERKYALDLFTRFMDINHKLITDGITAKKAFIALKEPTPPKGYISSYNGTLEHKLSGHHFSSNRFRNGDYCNINTIHSKAIGLYFNGRDKYETTKKLTDEKMGFIARCTI